MNAIAESGIALSERNGAAAESPRQSIQRWFGVLIGIAALHMTEQLLFGLDELDMIRRVLAKYYALFANPDFATASWSRS